MPLMLLRQILEETSAHLTGIFLNAQGEPLLHPEFVEILAMIKKFQVPIFALFTNGQLLEEYAQEIVESMIVQRLIVSIDGATQAVYEKYRIGGKIEKVIGGISSVVLQRTRCNTRFPYIQVHTTVLKTNLHEITTIQQLVRNLGVDRHRLKPCWFPNITLNSPWLDENFYKTWLPEDKNLWAYPVEEYEGRLKIKLPQVPQNTNHCPWHYKHSFVGYDGTIYACDCDQLYQNLAMGKLQYPNIDFASVWNGKLYQEHRKQIRQDILSHPFCRNCPRYLGGLLFLDTVY